MPLGPWKQTPGWSPPLVPSPAVVPDREGAARKFAGGESFALASSPASGWQGPPSSASSGPEVQAGVCWAAGAEVRATLDFEKWLKLFGAGSSAVE